MLNKIENIRLYSALTSLGLLGISYLRAIISHQPHEPSQMVSSMLVGALTGAIIGAGIEAVKYFKLSGHD